MEEREGDLRVPLISSLFCIFVSVGGVFLVLYVFVPDVSQPWFPPIALILIGSPWIFWILTYIYTCIKRCCGISSSNNNNGQISRRASRAPTMANSGMARNGSLANASAPQNNDNNHNDDDNNGSHSHGGDASVNSSKEIEMPLTSAAPS